MYADWELAREWIESADTLEQHTSSGAAHIFGELTGRRRIIPSRNTNRTVPLTGDEQYATIENYVRWNAAMCVQHANSISDGIGGHLSTFASSATLFSVAWDYFLKGRTHPSGGDHIYYQGHASPGVYARAYCEQRLSEQQLRLFRRETGGGLSSYPHPRLMPDFWEYPTVSMGLGPSAAIAQAYFDKYLTARHLADTHNQRVWAFIGDGECDEPETLALVRNAARWNLDNLTFVISCNLQRLDGPANGSGNTVGELASLFDSAGWAVNLCLWGERWEPLFAQAPQLGWHLATIPDGDMQRITANATSDNVRNELLGPWAHLVDNWNDEDIVALASDVGGASRAAVHTAYSAAVKAQRPSVVIARTIKGHLFPHAGKNAAHQIKKLAPQDLLTFADRLGIELDNNNRNIIEQGGSVFLQPDGRTAETLDRLGRTAGHTPTRRQGVVTNFTTTFDELETPNTKPVSTTAVLTRALKLAAADPHVVPIVADEGRTFGFDPLYSQNGIYSPSVNYTAVDAELALRYREDENGQIIQAGISESTAMAMFQAAGTAHATHGIGTIGWYTFYSMFGLQRVGDQIWQNVDARARGFLVGATAGRTTLNGEGLQHQDGHSLSWAMNVPHLNAYDCAFAYELGDVLRWQFDRWNNGKEELCYLVAYNEPWPQPARPATCRSENVIAGAYIYSEPDRVAAGDSNKLSATIAFSGPTWQASVAARDILNTVGVDITLISVTSYKQLWLNMLDCERHTRATRQPTTAHFSKLVHNRGPVIAVSDWTTALAHTVRTCVNNRFTALGTDGFGRSDTRDNLRDHYATSVDDIVCATLDLLDHDMLTPDAQTLLATLRPRFNKPGSWRADT
jgi:pyruvate dehydrogenase E1 component